VTHTNVTVASELEILKLYKVLRELHTSHVMFLSQNIKNRVDTE